MLGFGDHISESIAHFMGYFSTSVEAVKMRLEYREFKDAPDVPQSHGEILAIQTDPQMQLAPGTFVPDGNYLPMPWTASSNDVLPGVNIEPIDVQLYGHNLYHTAVPIHSSGNGNGQSLEQGPFIGPEVPETSMVLQQTSHMEDNDIVITGNHSPANLHWGDNADLATLSVSALLVSNAFSHDLPDTASGMAQFFSDQSDSMDVAEGLLTGISGITVVASPTAGIYVNGTTVSKAPVLDDYKPAQLATPNTPESATGHQALVINGKDIAGTVSLEAGSNILVNEIVLTNTGTSGAHFAVAGNYYNINAIVQTNAYSDIDSFGNGFVGQQQSCGPSTNAMNIADFISSTGHVQVPAATGEAPVFPQNWQVTVMNGDLMQMNWISQYNFLSDNDAHVLSSTGSYTTITTGSNGMLNTASFANLCNSYDLVIIGGHLYSGNLIFQTNVLFDDDTMTTGNGTGAYSGTLSTSDNLLWNSASIQSAGTTNWATGLPDHYKEAMSGLADGNYKMPDGFRSDAALQGMAGLKMLYISGNVYDLNYISQTNILGDSDFVARYEDALRATSHDTVWDLSTGSNALINVATIVDGGHGNGTSYAGGGVYSDSILIQAEIIAQQPGHGSGQGQPLANEIIAFLDDDASPSPDADHTPIHLLDTTHSVDVMQTALA
ncbi:hypothetical protein QFZ34_000193 [Phyllobacterium ifriqiyense]|uniref:Uncharacterized protein n=1 Tax=Phyllobacterium ifriqiyense TaxID=314238 RepID=A0ABU0S3B5_9HYPH|nr:hypothetical protein [Phyllobacterium ifriqiyense]MDQ0995016.1 hypothetical protein [Phyllobacterium ifriqiyense]